MREGFHLFVYGTLRSDGGAIEVLRGCQLVAVGTVRGTLYDLGAYPAVLLGGDDEVQGEIWRCPTDRLPALDRYEGVRDGLFRRAAVRVGGYACWIYVAGPGLGPQLVQEARVR